jgi:hypothetical protein
LETPGGEAGDKTKPDRVVGGKEDDWDGRGCRLGREHRRVTSGLLANQFGRQRRQSIDLIFGQRYSIATFSPSTTLTIRPSLAERARAARARSKGPFERPNAADYFRAFASASSFSSWLTRSCSADKRELSSPTLKNVTLLAGASRVLP